MPFLCELYPSFLSVCGDEKMIFNKDLDRHVLKMFLLHVEHSTSKQGCFLIVTGNEKILEGLSLVFTQYYNSIFLPSGVTDHKGYWQRSAKRQYWHLEWQPTRGFHLSVTQVPTIPWHVAAVKNRHPTTWFVEIIWHVESNVPSLHDDIFYKGQALE